MWDSLLTGLIAFVLITRWGFYIDDKISDQVRKKVYDLCRNIDRNRWPDPFIELFDRLFYSERKGRPKFWRSVLASCLVMVIITVAWLYRQPSAIELINAVSWPVIGVLTTYAVCINLLGDYFSLWETRAVLLRMAKRRDGRGRILLLLFDGLASALIFVAGLILGSVVFLFFWSLPDGIVDVLTLVKIVGSGVGETISSLFREGGIFLSDPGHGGSVLGIFLYTTFFTSVWVWTFLIGVLLLPLLKQLWSIFNVEKHPVGAAMCVGGAFFGLVLTIIHFVRNW